jgi:transcriptional regulator GlxA family with amidase domain
MFRAAAHDFEAGDRPADGLRSNVRWLAFGENDCFIEDLGLCVSIFSLPDWPRLDHAGLLCSVPGRCPARETWAAPARPSPRLRVPFDHLERGMQVKRLAIVICDGTPLGVMSFAFGVFDLAKHYGALPAIDLRVVAGEPGAVLSGGGLACPLPYDLGAVRDADLVVIADWRDPDEIPPQPLLEALRAAHAAGGRLAAMCSGAFILAAAGLLDGRPATTHWAQAGLLAGRYPAIDVRPDQLYVDDGDVLTAGGGAAGMDLGLHLLRAHFGSSVAARIARYMVVPPQRSGGQAQYLETPLLAPDLADPVGETLAWALGRLDQPLAVGHLARRARMSRRHFDRRFREVTGTTPATWLTYQRVLRARQLLEESRLPVEEVARQCGFSSAAALRPHFRRIVGTVPVAYRATFAVDDPVVP